VLTRIMSFTNNASKLTGKSITNSFNVVANNITVEQNELVKGNLTVLGNTNIGNVTLENGNVNNLTVNNLTVTTPIPYTSGGTGLSTIGSPNQVLTVNPTGTGLYYQGISLTNPSTITGTGFTGTPTFNFGIESSGGGNGRGFIRTSATELVLGSTTSDVLRLSGSGGSSNLTYNSLGSSGVFQVTNAGGAITFTNSGTGVISMAADGGSFTIGTSNISMVSGSSSLTLASGSLNLLSGASVMTIGTTLGQLNIGTTLGQLNVGTTAGQLNLFSNLVPTIGGPNAINIDAALGNISMITGGGQIFIESGVGAVNVGTYAGFCNLFGNAITLSADFIYLGKTVSPPHVPNIIFASGTLTGITGAWTITTGAIQINSLSQLWLNGNGLKITGSTEINSSIAPLTMTITGSANTHVLTCYQANMPTEFLPIIFGKSAAANLSAVIRFRNDNTTPADNYLGLGFYGNDDLYKITVGGAHIWRNTTAETMVLTPTGNLTVTSTTNTPLTVSTNTNGANYNFFAPLSTTGGTTLIVGRQNLLNEGAYLSWEQNNQRFVMGVVGNSQTIAISAGSTIITGNLTVTSTTNTPLTVSTNTNGANYNFFAPLSTTGGTTLIVGRQNLLNEGAYLSWEQNNQRFVMGVVGNSQTIAISAGSTIITGNLTVTSTTNTPLTVSTNTNGANYNFFTPLSTTGGTTLLVGRQNLLNEGAYLSWEQNNQRFVMGVVGNSQTIAISAGSTIITGNAYVSQNINWGQLSVNSNTSLSVTSPKTILVRGGSGVTITLPNATTLTVGWNYIINNNSNNTVTISNFTSTVITTVLSGQLANVYLITNPNPAGTWDYHLAGSVNSVTATSPIVATGTVNPVISISSTAPISLGPVTITAAAPAVPLTMNITGSTNTAAIICYQNSMPTEFMPIIFGKSDATNLSAVIRFRNNNTTPADNYLGLGFYGNDDLYKITVGGAHIWRNTTAETMVLTSTGNLTLSGTITSGNTIISGPYSNYSSPTLSVNSTTTTSGSIANFFAPVTSGNDVSIQLGVSSSLGSSGRLSWVRGSSTGLGALRLGISQLGLPAIRLQYETVLSPQITIDSGGPCIINSSSVSPFTVNTTTDGGTFKFLASNAANSGSALIIGKADAGNQGSYLSWEQNNQRFLMGILGNSFNIEIKSNSTTINNASLSGQVPFRSTGTNFYGSPTQYCEIGCSNPATSGDESLDMAFMYLGRKFSEQSVRLSYKNNTVYRNWSFGMGITGNQDLFGIWSTAGGNQCCFGNLGQMPTVPNGIVNISKRGGNGQVMTFYNPTDPVGSIVVGDVFTSYNTSSDYRLKENVVPMENILQKVLLLNPVSYTWKSFNSVGQGFIAHELQEIFPTCVVGEKDAVKENGEIIPQMVDYSKLTPFLTAALKDLYSLVQTLQDRITTLESQ
jgi:hypothetical protein